MGLAYALAQQRFRLGRAGAILVSLPKALSLRTQYAEDPIRWRPDSVKNRSSARCSGASLNALSKASNGRLGFWPGLTHEIALK